MSVGDFNQRVEGLWAAYFGCAAENFQHAGTTLLPRESLTGRKAIHIVYIRKRAMADIDASLKTEIEAMLGKLRGRPVLSSELMQRAWGQERIQEVEAGLVFHLLPGKLVRPELDPQFVLRRLSPDDRAALEGLRRQCTPDEVEDASVEIDHEIAWGCFKGSEPVAVGSGYRRNGFMDFGVLTCPEQRGHGLARHIVCSLSDDTLQRGLIPQYRCNRVNQASRRVAEGAGFTLYFTTERATLKA